MHAQLRYGRALGGLRVAAVERFLRGPPIAIRKALVRVAFRRRLGLGGKVCTASISQPEDLVNPSVFDGGNPAQIVFYVLFAHQADPALAFHRCFPG